MLKLFKKKNTLPARQLGNSCLNCNSTLTGDENYCPDCGQRNNINQLSFKLFVNEFFGDFFSYDSRLWGTVVPLILKPGRVALEFVNGKRKNLVNPFRTYLTVSLIFFLTYALIDRYEHYNDDGSQDLNTDILKLNVGDEGLSELKKDSIVSKTLANVQKDIPINLDSTLTANNVNIDSLELNNMSLDTVKKKAAEQSAFFKKVSSFYEYHKEHKDHSINQGLDSLGYPKTFWNRFYYDKAISTNKVLEDKAEDFNKKLFSSLSLAIFLFLPVFALFLKFIYIRRKYTYMEHLVFVFYTQSVLFLLLLLFVILYTFSNNNETLILIPIILFAIYLLLAMKYFYKQGWIKTTIKYIMANFSFMIISIISLSLLVLISFIFY